MNNVKNKNMFWETIESRKIFLAFNNFINFVLFFCFETCIQTYIYFFLFSKIKRTKKTVNRNDEKHTSILRFFLFLLCFTLVESIDHG